LGQVGVSVLLSTGWLIPAFSPLPSSKCDEPSLRRD